MFFKTLKRELAINYFIQVSLLTLAYFIAVPSPFIPEQFGFFHSVDLIDKLTSPLIPLLMVLYVTTAWLVLSALAQMLGRPLRKTDFVMYVSTTIVFSFLYIFTAVVFYLMISPAINHFRTTSATEIPFVATYVTMAVLIAVSWKWLTYIKLRTRIFYFHQDNGFSLKTIIDGWRGPLKIRGFLYFLLIVFVTAGIPILLLALGIYLQAELILAAALMASILCFTIGKFYLIYHLWSKLAP